MREDDGRRAEPILKLRDIVARKDLEAPSFSVLHDGQVVDRDVHVYYSRPVGANLFELFEALFEGGEAGLRGAEVFFFAGNHVGGSPRAEVGVVEFAR